MKTCFVQALVLTIYILGVQYLVTADNTSLELEEELVLYATNTTEKQFRDGIIRLENKYAAEWILDLFKNINPNDRDLLQTYSENYKRASEMSPNHDDYYYDSVEFAIRIKWNARLNFDLATNKYLSMLASTKNSSLTASNESVEKNLWKSNPKLHNMQNEVNELRAIHKDLIRDLVQTEKEARNTSDSNKRGILEREVEDLINEINALEEKLRDSVQNLDDVHDNLLSASPELKAAEERNLDTTDKYFYALNDHLEILKNLEIQRIDVLELLSSKERIQMYESILQEELN
uniref:Secreted protein n=1 Tax=Schistosoma mansoni TaxID=6183 RepID=A0A5K4F4F4_SCHMA